MNSLHSQPIISLIAAMAKNRVIGKDNHMPWHLPADLAHFKKTTMNKPIIMGRKTFESIGKPLPGRQNIVVTRSPTFQYPSVQIVHSLDEALIAMNNEKEVFIMGGGNIYQQMIHKADYLYITHIDLEVEGDTQFPEYKHLGWNKIAKETRKADDKNAYDCTFVTLKRVS